MLEQSSPCDAAFNILKLLFWLNEGSLSASQIQSRYQEHNCPVDLETLQSYLTLLHTLGCEVTENELGLYALKQHPFRIFMTSKDLEVLSESFLHTIDSCSPDEVFHFQRWVQKVFDSVVNKDRYRLWEAFLEKTRTPGYTDLTSCINVLENACKARQPISIRYCSPVHGVEQLHVLPEKLFHRHGVVYLLGFKAGQAEASMLRLEGTEKEYVKAGLV